MISKDSETTKEFVRVLFEKTRKRDFVSSSLAFIKSENNMKKIIDFVSKNPDCTMTDIDIEIVKLTK